MLEDLSGKTIGDYEIHRLIGKGGMGTVYEARQVSIPRQVAIKFPHHDKLQEDYQQRFVREGRTSEKVRHVNIVETYSIETHQGTPFIVMEYVQGRPLTMIIGKEVKLDLPKALDIGVQVANALAKMHAVGIVHRDIKPANIMIKEDGMVKIMDFGIARIWQRETDPAKLKNDWIGTPFYVSPEQCRGERLDHRSDLYSLGVVLFEMLTGRVPFSSDKPNELIRLIQTAPVPSMRAINPLVPDSLQTIVDMALAKKPEDRYSSAKEMRLDLTDVARELGIKLPDRTVEIRPSVPPPVPLSGDHSSSQTTEKKSGLLRDLFRRE